MIARDGAPRVSRRPNPLRKSIAACAASVGLRHHLEGVDRARIDVQLASARRHRSGGGRSRCSRRATGRARRWRCRRAPDRQGRRRARGRTSPCDRRSAGNRRAARSQPNWFLAWVQIQFAGVAVLPAIVRAAGAPVEHRIDQHLPRQRGPAAVAGHQREGGGEPAAGAFAHHHDPRRIDAEAGGVLGQPQQRGVVVLLRAGKRRLRARGGNRPRPPRNRARARGAACRPPRGRRCRRPCRRRGCAAPRRDLSPATAGSSPPAARRARLRPARTPRSPGTAAAGPARR